MTNNAKYYKIALSIVALGLFVFAAYYFYKYYQNRQILKETTAKATASQKANRNISFSKA